MLAAELDSEISLYDVIGINVIHCNTILHNKGNRIKNMSFNRDGSLLAASTKDPEGMNSILLWHVATASLTKSIKIDFVASWVLFSCDNEILIISNENSMFTFHITTRQKSLFEKGC